jgi:hypothetical protein
MYHNNTRLFLIFKTIVRLKETNHKFQIDVQKWTLRSIVCNNYSFSFELEAGYSSPYIFRVINNFIIIGPESIFVSLISTMSLSLILMFIVIVRLLFYWLFKVVPLSLLEREWNIICNCLLSSLNMLILYLILEVEAYILIGQYF